MARLQRFGELMLSRVLPTTTAKAEPCCGGACGYQYRCTSTGYYQRRYCCYTCDCRASCDSWRTVARGC